MVADEAYTCRGRQRSPDHHYSLRRLVLDGMQRPQGSILRFVFPSFAPAPSPARSQLTLSAFFAGGSNALDVYTLNPVVAPVVPAPAPVDATCVSVYGICDAPFISTPKCCVRPLSPRQGHSLRMLTEFNLPCSPFFLPRLVCASRRPVQHARLWESLSLKVARTSGSASLLNRRAVPPFPPFSRPPPFSLSHVAVAVFSSRRSSYPLMVSVVSSPSLHCI